MRAPGPRHAAAPWFHTTSGRPAIASATARPQPLP